MKFDRLIKEMEFGMLDSRTPYSKCYSKLCNDLQIRVKIKLDHQEF